MYIPSFVKAFNSGLKLVDLNYRNAKLYHQNFYNSKLEKEERKLEIKCDELRNNGCFLEKSFLRIGECLRQDKLLAIVAYAITSPVHN